MVFSFVLPPLPRFVSFFFFNDTATTEIYTLSLHDALPIWDVRPRNQCGDDRRAHRRHSGRDGRRRKRIGRGLRSEEHTSELQSPCNLVCRLLLEKKKKKRKNTDMLSRTKQ